MTSNADPHWHYYPISRLGEWSRATVATTVWAAIGLAPLFILNLVLGVIAEENRLGSLSEPFDDLLRFTGLMLLTLGLLAWLAGSLASYLERRAISRSLADAATAGAPVTRLPAPEQVKAVIKPPAKELALCALIAGPCLLLFGVTILVGDDYPLTLGAVMTLAGAVLIPLGLAARTRMPRTHQQRHEQIAAHWTREHEERVWSTASTSDKSSRRNKSAAPGPARRGRLWETIAAGCTFFGGGLALLAFLPFVIGLSMRCSGAPGSARAGSECHETSYSEPVERLLGLSWWMFAVAVAVGFVLFVVALLAYGVADRLDRSLLLDQVADPASGRPDRSLLATYSRRRSHPVAGALAMLAVGSIAVGTAVQQLGVGSGLGSQEFFAPHQGTGLLIAGCGIAMLAIALVLNWRLGVGGRELRNALIHRWPIRAPKGQRYRLAAGYGTQQRKPRASAR